MPYGCTKARMPSAEQDRSLAPGLMYVPFSRIREGRRPLEIWCYAASSMMVTASALGKAG